MRTRGILRWAMVGVLVLATGAALALVVSSSVLYREYRPTAPGVERYLLTADHRSALDWIDREHTATVALLALVVLAAAGGLVMLLVDRTPAWAVALAGSVVAVIGTIVSLATRIAVQWQQLGLQTVTVGSDLYGYEAATSSQMVRFVLVDGREISPPDYRLGLLAHMGGGAVALLGLLVAVVAALGWGGRGGQAVWVRTKAASSSTASTASGNAG